MWEYAVISVQPVCCIEKLWNLDVDLEAIACVHSLQYSTVILSVQQYNVYSKTDSISTMILMQLYYHLANEYEIMAAKEKHFDLRG